MAIGCSTTEEMVEGTKKWDLRINVSEEQLDKLLKHWFLLVYGAQFGKKEIQEFLKEVAHYRIKDEVHSPLSFLA